MYTHISHIYIYMYIGDREGDREEYITENDGKKNIYIYR